MASLSLSSVAMSQRVTIRTEEETKSRWKEAVEDSREYESLTHLIELAVDREIGHVGGNSANSGSSVEYSPNVSNTELFQKIEKLEQSIDDIGTDMSVARRELTATQKDDLTDEILEILPKSESDAKRPSKIAISLDYEPYEVLHVCKKLEKEMGRVKETETGEFWKDV